MFTEEVIQFLSSFAPVERQGETLTVHANQRTITIQLASLKAPYPSDTGIVLWEDEWFHKKEIIQSRLKYLLGESDKIHGRNTKVIDITKPEADRFFNENHQKGTVSYKHKYGLAHKGQLVAVVAFSNSCPVHRDGKKLISYQLLRFCNLKNTNVVGGLDKLIKHFERKRSPEDIMTSIDKEWSTGAGFKKLGFKVIDDMPAYAFWVDPNTHTRYRTAETAPEEAVKILNRGNIKMALTW